MNTQVPMRLSKLYSNKPNLFEPVLYNNDVNVILAEIRVPENRNKDTHNLGKTTIGRLLDFCFLSKKDPEMFLFKHFSIFQDFVFFLEIELKDKTYLTVRRSVGDPTRIGFKKHSIRNQDFSFIEDAEWDHFGIPFDRSVQLLDGILDWNALSPWNYRKGLGYQLRTQDDYQDVFQLQKFSHRQSEWKPFLAHLLGFNSKVISSQYIKEDDLSKKKIIEQTIKNELGGSVEDISKTEGLLLLKNKEVDKKQLLLDAFDFRKEDKYQTKIAVDEIDQGIANLNNDRYTLDQNRKKIISAMEEDKILFNPDEAQALFKQVGIYFEGQIKKDFTQLIEFNTAITEERRSYLQEELSEIDTTLAQINKQLNDLGKKRSEVLSFLSSTDVFSKYKFISDEVVKIRTEIGALEKQRDFLTRLQNLRTDIRNLNEEIIRQQSDIENDVENQNTDKSSMFSTIRLYFNDIIESVISQKALLEVTTNKDGHLQFKAEILDEAGNETSAGLGHTYRKLMCIAFDLAILRSRINDRFPKFVFHDGVFESLDNRKKENLLKVLREYSSLGIQTIITLIDSEIPEQYSNINPMFSDEEIILHLHDENNQGRLFKIDAW